jgi:tellurite resistance protein
MLKKIAGSRKLLLVPAVIVAAAGFATQSGAVSTASPSRTVQVCRNLDNKEARQEAALAAAPAGSRRSFILQFQISQTEKQEANHNCPGG